MSAFDRFMVRPEKSDKGCGAKTGAAEALYRIGHDCPDVFSRGVTHVQLEPVFGGRTDTAAELRGVCAMGLVRLCHPEVMVHLADLLADPEPPARIAAARAIAYSGRCAEGVPLLRLKALTGDDEPAVVGECLLALLGLDPDSSLPFVAGFLDRHDGALREAAAMALGESRVEGAFAVLRQWWDRTPDTRQARTALLAIAMLRHDDAMDFLLSLLADHPPAIARQVIDVLKIYRNDESLERRIREIAAQRDDPELTRAIHEAFSWEPQ